MESTKYSEYTHKISTEPSYYGSDCTSEDAERIFRDLGNLIKSKFPGIQIERYTDGLASCKTVGPDDEVIAEIDSWVAENWTAAL